MTDASVRAATLKEMVANRMELRRQHVTAIEQIDAELAEVGISVRPKRERKPRSDKGTSKGKGETNAESKAK